MKGALRRAGAIGSSEFVKFYFKFCRRADKNH